MRGRTNDLEGDLDDTPTVTPPQDQSPVRESGKNKEMTATEENETSFASSGTRISGLEVTQVRMSGEGPMGERR